MGVDGPSDNVNKANKVVQLADVRLNLQGKKLNAEAERFLGLFVNIGEARNAFVTELDPLEESLRASLSLAFDSPRTNEITKELSAQITNHLFSCRAILVNKGSGGSAYDRWDKICEHLIGIASPLMDILDKANDKSRPSGLEGENDVVILKRYLAQKQVPEALDTSINEVAFHLDAVITQERVIQDALLTIESIISNGIDKLIAKPGTTAERGPDDVHAAALVENNIKGEIKKARLSLEDKSEALGSLNMRLNDFQHYLTNAALLYLDFYKEIAT